MDSTLFHGTLPFIMESPAVSRGGRGTLDSFRARLLCSADWQTEARALGFEIDKKLTGYHSLWVKSLEPENEAEIVVVVDVTGEGLSATGDRRQRKMQCGEQQTSVGPDEKIVIVWVSDETGKDPVTDEELPQVPRRVPKLDDEGEPVLKPIITPSGTFTRWLVSEAEVTLIDTYFTTTKPAMNGVGQVFSPPNPPAVPAYLWGGYTGTLRSRHPNGWILADRTGDEIYYVSDAIGLWKVTDTVVFRQAAAPE